MFENIIYLYSLPYSIIHLKIHNYKSIENNKQLTYLKNFIFLNQFFFKLSIDFYWRYIDCHT